MMGNDEFEKFINQLCNKSGYNSAAFGSSRNQTIDDLIKSLSEELDECCEEMEQRRNGTHKPKFTDEEFNKTCEELGLVEDK